ncbi:MAG TPA: hypothetical protein VF956_03895 [Candidatus Dormibacteraeota bacterium]
MQRTSLGFFRRVAHRVRPLRAVDGVVSDADWMRLFLVLLKIF